MEAISYPINHQQIPNESYQLISKKEAASVGLMDTQEIAQLIGGREITEKTFSVAYEMLEQAQNAIR